MKNGDIWLEVEGGHPPPSPSMVIYSAVMQWFLFISFSLWNYRIVVTFVYQSCIPLWLMNRAESYRQRDGILHRMSGIWKLLIGRINQLIHHLRYIFIFLYAFLVYSAGIIRLKWHVKMLHEQLTILLLTRPQGAIFWKWCFLFVRENDVSSKFQVHRN